MIVFQTSKSCLANSYGSFLFNFEYFAMQINDFCVLFKFSSHICSYGNVVYFHSDN